MIGIAGFFKKSTAGILGGVFTGVAGRFICHVLSGVVAYAQYAPEGQSPWVYSIFYNGTFLLPEFAITIVLTLLIFKFIRLPEPKLDSKSV
jgi:thiamine transporter